MESQHASKRAKLHQLLQFKAKLPAHSQSALEAILKEAQKSGIPDVVSSNFQREARLQLLADYHGGALGPLIQESTLELEDGQIVPMYCTNLLVYMANLYNKNTSFTKPIQECHRRCHPQWTDHGDYAYIAMKSFLAIFWAEQKEKLGAFMPPLMLLAPTCTRKTPG